MGFRRINLFREPISQTDTEEGETDVCYYSLGGLPNHPATEREPLLVELCGDGFETGITGYGRELACLKDGSRLLVTKLGISPVPLIQEIQVGDVLFFRQWYDSGGQHDALDLFRPGEVKFELHFFHGFGLELLPVPSWPNEPVHSDREVGIASLPLAIVIG